MEKEYEEIKLGPECFSKDRVIKWDEESKAVFFALAGCIDLPIDIDSTELCRRIRGKA